MGKFVGQVTLESGLTAVVWKDEDDGCFGAKVLDREGLACYGTSPNEALTELRAALAGALVPEAPVETTAPTADERGELREENHQIVELAGVFHDHGLFLPTRTIYVGGKCLGHKMADTFVKNMHVLESFGDDPIKVLWNNRGGDVYHGLAMRDAITESPCEVTVVARGYVMSMGSCIMQAADRRVMGPRSTQMLHYGSTGGAGHAKTMKKHTDESERLDGIMEQDYLERIREKQPEYTLEALQALLDHDTFLTAQQSVDLGLADEVG